MSAHSKIEWTDASWTPIRARDRATGKLGWHCEHVSEGCRNCYAERMNIWRGTGFEFKPGHREDVDIFLDEEMLTAPLRWKKPRMIFVCSMTDLFAEFVPDEWIDKMFAIMALCPQHKFQVPTKRAERMWEYFEDDHREMKIGVAAGDMLDGDWIWNEGKKFRAAIDRLIDIAHGEPIEDDNGAGQYECLLPLPNVWLGVSCERQQEADERIPLLLQTPAAVRFVSAEPLLGPLALNYCNPGDRCIDALNGTTRYGERTRPNGPLDSSRLEPSIKLDWVIVGGESGAHARPMHPNWVRSLRDQCDAADVKFFFKQWGEWGPTTSRARPPYPDFEPMEKWGKKRAGRLLDGREHNEFPHQHEPAVTDDAVSRRSALVNQD